MTTVPSRIGTYEVRRENRPGCAEDLDGDDNVGSVDFLTLPAACP